MTQISLALNITIYNISPIATDYRYAYKLRQQNQCMHANRSVHISFAYVRHTPAYIWIYIIYVQHARIWPHNASRMQAPFHYTYMYLP